MILRTQRLHLRPMLPTDAPALFAMLRDPTAMAFWDRPPLAHLPVAEELVREQLAAMASGHCLYWTVLRDQDVIGSCDLSLIDRAQATAETGFLFRPMVWGKAYAQEAMREVIAHAQNTLGLTQLTARIHCGNAPARRLLTRLGFTLERTLPGHALPDGRTTDCELYRLNTASRAKSNAQ